MIKGAFGNAMYPNNLWDWLTQFLDQNDMRHFSFHALRHTHASMMKWMGYDLLDVSAELGHSEKSTTLNVYAHIFEDRKEKAHNMAAGISSLIANSK